MSKLKVKSGGVKNLNPIKYLYFIIIYCIIITSGTYAYQYINTTSSNITGMGGCFNVNYTGENITTSSISTTTNYEDGSKTTVTLSKNSSCKLYTEANIYLHTNNNTTAPIETIPALKYKLYNGSSQISEGTITNKNDYLLGTVPLTDTSTTYTVYLYIDPAISIGNYNGTSYSGYIYADSHQTSTIEGNYLVSFDKGNLLYGLDDVGETTTVRMKYSITNEVVTATASGNDGYGLTPIKVYLESGKNYIFNCDTDGTWESNSNDNNNQVEAFLMRSDDGSSWTSWKHMNSNSNFEFTPTETGLHYLRLDVNKIGETHTFSNISITEKESSMQTKTVTVGQNYGWLPTPSRDGYTFKGWNGKNLLNPSGEYAERFDGAINRSYIEYDNNNKIYTAHINNHHHIYGYNIIKYINLGDTYTYSANIVENGTSEYTHIGFDMMDNGSRVVKYSNLKTTSNQRISYTYTIPSTVTSCIVGVGNNGDEDGVKFNNLQLEKGNTATEYEPYFVTNSTTVTQDKNHTLTAIWEKNN